MRALRSFALAAALAAAALPLAATGQTNPPAGDPVRGKANFIAYGCYECHGTVGQGNLGTAPRLAPHPIPLVGILAYIRKPAGEMPSYSATILPDKDVADIYAYLASIPDGKDPAAIAPLSHIPTTPK